MNELNSREQNIVDLINQLSEYANSEETTEETISNIIGKIKNSTKENISAEMESLKNQDPNEISKSAIDLEMNIMAERMKELEKMKIGKSDDVNEHSCCCHSEKKNSLNFTFTRIREVKAPGKAHPTDAGIDFYVPNEKAWDEDFKDKVIKYSRNADTIDLEFTDKGLIVLPNAHVAIPSGIKTIIPQGLGMMFVNKSGVATKMKLDHSACLVDSEYRDEIIMCFFNHNTEPVLIEPGMKITQGLIVPIINVEVQEVLNCVYDDMGKETDRGGGFGSSGTK